MNVVCDEFEFSMIQMIYIWIIYNLFMKKDKGNKTDKLDVTNP